MHCVIQYSLKERTQIDTNGAKCRATIVYRIEAIDISVCLRLVEALGHKLEGCGFVFRWCHWNFSLTQSFLTHYDPGVDSSSNRNEYQEYFPGSKGGRFLGLNLAPSRADCLEIWEPQPPGTLKAWIGLYIDCLTFTVCLSHPQQYTVCLSHLQQYTVCLSLPQQYTVCLSHLQQYTSWTSFFLL
jgi:hypothetical protein